MQYRTKNIEDEHGTVHDIEMQIDNEKNLPRRSHYYQSLIDSELLIQGERDFNKLNNVMIIIVTPFDIFGQNRYQYTFEHRCQEDTDLLLHDGAKRIFLNNRGKNENEVRPELIQFLKYVENSTAVIAKQTDSEKILQIHELLTKLKCDRKVGALFMKSREWEEYIREKATKEGLQQGMEQGIRACIRVLRDSNVPEEVIETSLVKQFNLETGKAKQYLQNT